MNIFH